MVEYLISFSSINAATSGQSRAAQPITLQPITLGHQSGHLYVHAAKAMDYLPYSRKNTCSSYEMTLR